MKKDDLLGMEVYYEENPQIHHGPIGPRGHTGVTGPVGVPAPKGVWVFGDSDEEDDFSNYDEPFNEPDEYHFNLAPEVDDAPAIPVKGRIYHIKGLNVTAKLAAIRPLTKTAGILEMSHHKQTFFINPSDLKKASPKQVESYLQESDYNNT